MPSHPVKDAAAIEKEFKDYAYVVSHDLGAPVRAMVEFSRLLKEEQKEKLSEEAILYLTLIIDSGEKMQRMLKGLLEYSRLNTKTYTPASIDMNKAVAQCMAGLADKIKAGKAQITYDRLPTVVFDAERMGQLLTAVIDNAITFVPQGREPVVTITAQEEEKQWHFLVEDNGLGIGDQFHQKIFGIFQRLHTDEEYPGIGMGLTLVQKILQMQGGSVWIEGGVGSGTRLHFTFPKE